jgi:hypothetical protein
MEQKPLGPEQGALNPRACSVERGRLAYLESQHQYDDPLASFPALVKDRTAKTNLLFQTKFANQGVLATPEEDRLAFYDWKVGNEKVNTTDEKDAEAKAEDKKPVPLVKGFTFAGSKSKITPPKMFQSKHEYLPKHLTTRTHWEHMIVG